MFTFFGQFILAWLAVGFVGGSIAFSIVEDFIYGDFTVGRFAIKMLLVALCAIMLYALVMMI